MLFLFRRASQILHLLEMQASSLLERLDRGVVGGVEFGVASGVESLNFVPLTFDYAYRYILSHGIRAF